MKRNYMKLAALLLALVLVTSCFVGGTFAKYVTKYEANDNTRIAYWGFHADGTVEFNLFSDEYDGTVESGNGDNVVAPGTTQKATIEFRYVDSTLEGVTAPEVDYTLNFELTAANKDGSELDADQKALLETLKWKAYLNGINYGFMAEGFTNMANFLNSELGGREQPYEAGTLPRYWTGEETDSIELEWAWAFEGDDVVDTDFGNRADSIKDIVITFKVVAEQVD